MKTIVNQSHRPIRIALPGNHILHLGPSRSGQIADHHAALPALRKLIDEGVVIVVGEAAHPEMVAAERGHVHEGTHGHEPVKVVRPRGDR